jgi:hypothetical protein
MLSLGGGVELLVSPHFAIGVDARFQRIFEGPVFRPNLANLTRIGTSVGYRF